MISNDIPFDWTEFGTGLPPVPDEIQKMVAEWGGFTEGYPNARLVSGTDPDLKEWCAGEWIPKYSVEEVESVEYYIWTKPDGTKKILSPKEFQVVSKVKLKGIILPVRENKVFDHLIPRYILEVYRPSFYFGTKEVWNSVRYKEENGRRIDLLGDFPENGRYEQWFVIEDLEVDLQGKPVRSVFRGLDGETLEFIREMIQVSKTMTSLQQHQEATKQVAEQAEKREKEFKEDLRYALKDRIDKVVGTPKSTNIK
jgi:hypothetical protein